VNGGDPSRASHGGVLRCGRRTCAEVLPSQSGPHDGSIPRRCPRSAGRRTAGQKIFLFLNPDDCVGPRERTSGHLLLVAGLGVLDEQDAQKQSVDERTRTADLLQLRVSLFPTPNSAENG